MILIRIYLRVFPEKNKWHSIRHRYYFRHNNYFRVFWHRLKKNQILKYFRQHCRTDINCFEELPQYGDGKCLYSLSTQSNVVCFETLYLMLKLSMYSFWWKVTIWPALTMHTHRRATNSNFEVLAWLKSLICIWRMIGPSSERESYELSQKGSVFFMRSWLGRQPVGC